jgi:hypothetical protein
MKKTLTLLAALAMASAVYAQGTIQFFSLNEIKRPDGSGAGAGYTAGLFLASDLNTPLGTTDFIPGTGFLNAIDIIVPGFPVGSANASYVVRAWETGKTFATSGVRGETPSPFTAGPLGGPNPTPGQPPITPTDLGPNFLGFTMVVPEPSTYALGIAGLGALAMMRRRK